MKYYSISIIRFFWMVIDVIYFIKMLYNDTTYSKKIMRTKYFIGQAIRLVSKWANIK
jgi:hypothetical protein